MKGRASECAGSQIEQRKEFGHIRRCSRAYQKEIFLGKKSAETAERVCADNYHNIEADKSPSRKMDSINHTLK
jgi:hypothetical protein